MQRKTNFRNERNLYKRVCGACTKPLISMYSKDNGIPVYCTQCWWRDTWDAKDYGCALDLEQSFLSQFSMLMKKVPCQANVILNSENCDYNSYCVDSKDCYMCQRVQSESTMYSYLGVKCLKCCDCSYVYSCEQCYECIDCWNCYNTSYSRVCKNSSDCAYCYDCIGCKHCIGCYGLRNAEFAIFNEKCTPEEFAEITKQLCTSTGSQKLCEQFQKKLLHSFPRRPLIIEQSEDAFGDAISKSRDIQDSFDIEESQSVRHSIGVEYSKDISDSCFVYYGELCYENMSNSHSSFINCCGGTYDSSYLLYCLLCYGNTSHCFGCSNMRGAKYCILNRQYSQEEYERLVPKIIEKMQSEGEWGAFFPPSLSPFCYNETVAHEYFPLKSDQVHDRGWRWKEEREEPLKVEKIIPGSELPDTIDAVPDDILDWAIECESTKRPFKVIKQELELYRQMKLPLPRLHPDERHRRRMALRNPRRLWDRACATCKKSIATSYSPDRSEIVYCEECYLKEVY